MPKIQFPKTSKEITQKLKLIFEVQEKTSSSRVPIFSLWPRNYRFSNLQEVQRHMNKRYAAGYHLDRTQKTGDWDVYYFKARPAEELNKRDKGSSRAPYVQLRVRPKLLNQ